MQNNLLLGGCLDSGLYGLSSALILRYSGGAAGTHPDPTEAWVPVVREEHRGIGRCSSCFNLSKNP